MHVAHKRRRRVEFRFPFFSTPFVILSSTPHEGNVSSIKVTTEDEEQAVQSYIIFATFSPSHITYYPLGNPSISCAV